VTIKFKEYIIPKSTQKKLWKLPKNIRNKFFSSVKKLSEDPSYPALRHKKVKGSKYWEFSITMNYRVNYLPKGDTMIIVNVGTHDEVL